MGSGAHLLLLILHHILSHFEGAQVFVHALQLRVVGGVLVPVQQSLYGFVIVVNDAAVLLFVLTCRRTDFSSHNSPPSLSLSSSPKLPSTLTFSLILEQLFCSKLEDVIQLLLGHGARLGSEARPDHQVSQHHLLLGNLERAEQVRREGPATISTLWDSAFIYLSNPLLH